MAEVQAVRRRRPGRVGLPDDATGDAAGRVADGARGPRQGDSALGRPALQGRGSRRVDSATGQAAVAGQLAVRARGLRRSFGETTAVAGVDLDVARGAVFGLLGPDGAGKSTLIRLLATTLLPDAGDAEVFGMSVADEAKAVRPRIGYMSQRFSLYPDLSVRENMDFFATIRGVPKAVRRVRGEALLESMGLAEFAGRQAMHLSGGMKQKLMLATTLMHEPDLLLLDEPTTGVDPVSRREFWRILADLHRDGKTVFVATPYMDEAERCTDVAFLDAGTIRQTGTPDQLKALVPGRLLEVRVSDSRAAAPVLAALPGALSAHPLGDTVRLLWDGDDDPDVDGALAPSGVEALAVRQLVPDMETVFTYLAEPAPGNGESDEAAPSPVGEPARDTAPPPGVEPPARRDGESARPPADASQPDQSAAGEPVWAESGQTEEARP
ncbi:MAG: ATP-binding cassette domain-containing protein [Propionibacteriaceae bacterium]|jgi:ABC-2 type transport system ATP-binding protein|nr:ATP-binding cassette domain-containing protein [Propionibacteriaceae bacterium]